MNSEQRKAHLQEIESLKEQTIEWEVEWTDKFGDVPNYSWVKRETMTLKAHYKRQYVVKKAKELFGLSHTRHDTTDLGDSIQVDIRDPYTILFITPKYD